MQKARCRPTVTMHVMTTLSLVKKDYLLTEVAQLNVTHCCLQLLPQGHAWAGSVAAWRAEPQA